MSNKNNKKKGFSISRLFESNRFVLIFSVFVAIILWFTMAINNTENRARVIYDIPIEAALPEEAVEQGYQIFEQSDVTARVSVTGNNLIVNQLSKDDIRVFPALSSNITRTGTYTLNLKAEQKSGLTGYEFDTINPGAVILFVDKYQEKTLTVEQNIDYTVADGYFASAPVLQDTKITISGPETEVSAVGKIVLEKTLDGALTSSAEFTQAFTLYDKEGNKLPNLGHMKLTAEETLVKIDVMRRADLPVVPTFTNLPEGLSVDNLVTVSPTTLKIGCYKNSEEEAINAVSLQPIDLSQVTPQQTTFSVDFELPENCTNISGVKNAVVKFNLSGYRTQTYTIDNFVVNNLAEGQKATVDTTQLQVTVVGPAAQLKRLKASDLYAEADMTGKEKLTGSAAVPVKIRIDSKFQSWAAGSYEVYVNITH